MEEMKKMIPMMIVMMVFVIASVIYIGQGIQKHNQVPGAEAEFHSLQTDYIVNNTKAERDTAPAGSDLAKQQAVIANTPSTLLELKLIGVGRTLTGIAILLGAILMALIIMPVRLGRIVNGEE